MCLTSGTLSRAALLVRSQRHTIKPLFFSLWKVYEIRISVSQISFVSPLKNEGVVDAEWRVRRGGTAGGAGCRLEVLQNNQQSGKSPSREVQKLKEKNLVVPHSSQSSGVPLKRSFTFYPWYVYYNTYWYLTGGKKANLRTER